MMAVLGNEKMKVEITHEIVDEYGYIYYKMNFFVDNIPMFNNKVMPVLYSESRGRHQVDCFNMSYEPEFQNPFIKYFEELLQENKPEVWVDDSMHFTIAALPAFFVPDMLHIFKDRLKKRNGTRLGSLKLTEKRGDLIQLIFYIDSSIFNKHSAIGGDGAAIILNISGKELRLFIKELKDEYKEKKKTAKSSYDEYILKYERGKR